MLKRPCVLDETRACIACGDCSRCDLDEDKLCDNCMRCVRVDADYLAVEIDEIIEEEQG